MGLRDRPRHRGGALPAGYRQKDSEDAVFGALGEGRFVLFFPGELHRPGVEMPGCDRVRKAVVKIKMEDKYHG
ncbi:MAG: YhcH/YjgK/YiaL family protein [Faecalibacterium sp.]